MPFQRMALGTERVGPIEGQKLTVCIAAYRTFYVVAEGINGSPYRCLHGSELFSARWTNYFFKNRFHE